MALQRNEIEAIRRATFPRSWGWRGYDRGEVERFLEAIANRLEAVSAEEAVEEPAGAGTRTRRAPAKPARRTRAKPARRTQARPARRTAKATGARRTRTEQPRARQSARGGRRRRLDINKATFAQLRRLGLSATVAARLIALRDIRGGFQDIDALEDVEGLSQKAIRQLKGMLYADAGRGSS